MNVKIFAGILVSLLFVLAGCSTGKDMQAVRASYQQDFDVFREIFEKGNAGLYKYHSKQQTDSVFDDNRQRITGKTSYRDFYNILWNVIDYTGSCHNKLAYPDSLDKAISRQKIFFPLPLKHISGKLYSTSSLTTIPFGSEIVSVNGEDAATFAQKSARYLSTDGHNTTGKFAFLETDWLPFYVYLAYGEQKSFSVKYKSNGKIMSATLPATDYKTAATNHKQRFIPPGMAESDEDYTFQYLSASTGLLTVNTFGMGGPESEGHKQYAVFLNSLFSGLKAKNIKNLIVDVRQNGGGNDPNDLLLYSYLTQRRFRENTGACTLFNTVPLKEYYVEEDEGEIEELEQELKEEHSVLKDGRYYQNDLFNPVWKPKANAFSGKIYLLISPNVASAGSLFAAMVKSDDDTVVIGEETLGGYYGHTGHIPVTYRLPNTGLLLTFSIVDLEQDVRKIPDQSPGDGIRPDHKVLQTIEDYVGGKDTVLEFAKKLALTP